MQRVATAADLDYDPSEGPSGFEVDDGYDGGNVEAWDDGEAVHVDGREVDESNSASASASSAQSATGASRALRKVARRGLARLYRLADPATHDSARVTRVVADRAALVQLGEMCRSTPSAMGSRVEEWLRFREQVVYTESGMGVVTRQVIAAADDAIRAVLLAAEAEASERAARGEMTAAEARESTAGGRLLALASSHRIMVPGSPMVAAEHGANHDIATAGGAQSLKRPESSHATDTSDLPAPYFDPDRRRQLLGGRATRSSALEAAHDSVDELRLGIANARRRTDLLRANLSSLQDALRTGRAGPGDESRADALAEALARETAAKERDEQAVAALQMCCSALVAAEQDVDAARREAAHMAREVASLDDYVAATEDRRGLNPQEVAPRGPTVTAAPPLRAASSVAASNGKPRDPLAGSVLRVDGSEGRRVTPRDRDAVIAADAGPPFGALALRPVSPQHVTPSQQLASQTFTRTRVGTCARTPSSFVPRDSERLVDRLRNDRGLPAGAGHERGGAAQAMGVAEGAPLNESLLAVADRTEDVLHVTRGTWNPATGTYTWSTVGQYTGSQRGGTGLPGAGPLTRWQTSQARTRESLTGAGRVPGASSSLHLGHMRISSREARMPAGRGRILVSRPSTADDPLHHRRQHSRGRRQPESRRSSTPASKGSLRRVKAPRMTKRLVGTARSPAIDASELRSRPRSRSGARATAGEPGRTDALGHVLRVQPKKQRAAMWRTGGGGPARRAAGGWGASAGSPARPVSAAGADVSVAPWSAAVSPSASPRSIARSTGPTGHGVPQEVAGFMGPKDYEEHGSPLLRGSPTEQESFAASGSSAIGAGSSAASTTPQPTDMSPEVRRPLSRVRDPSPDHGEATAEASHVSIPEPPMVGKTM